MSPDITLTIAALRASGADYPDLLADELATKLGRRPSEAKPVPLLAWLGLSSMSDRAAIWVLRAAEPRPAAHHAAVTVAVKAARRVLHMLSGSEHAIALAAIEAAEAWLASPTPAQAARAGVAATAADVASDAANKARHTACFQTHKRATVTDEALGAASFAAWATIEGDPNGEAAAWGAVWVAANANGTIATTEGVISDAALCAEYSFWTACREDLCALLEPAPGA